MSTQSSKSWSVQDSAEYYGFNRWGGQHFSIAANGDLQVHPLADERGINLHKVIQEAREMGLEAPLTIRVQDMLRNRIEQLNKAFAQAIEEEQYSGKYRGVFPIKVNQLREVVDEILDAGKPFDFGLEAGSKPELLIALAMLQSDKALLICNGYKDDDYIRLAMLGRQLGKEIVLVVEQLSEVESIIKIAKEHNVTPLIGIRLKLQTRGEGKWATSTGDHAKFGLSSTEVMAACRRLKRAGLSESLCLIHFHIGSQVPNILTIKQALNEATRYYCEIHRMGFPLQYLDVGGGLGIDYDGSRTNFESSMNYSLDVYARDIVFNIKNVCESADVPCPDIVSESGRAIVASHSILVTEVVDRISKLEPVQKIPKRRKQPQAISDLLEILESGDRYGMLERYHDAQQKREEINSLFGLGYIDLQTRAEADSVFWQICNDIHQSCLKREGYIPDELADLNQMLAQQYVCNFSIFQSLLDHWALDQLFPVAPVHRLDQEPTVLSTIVDITCDSDGKISEFIDLEDVKHALKLHPFKPSEPYYIGVFLVGAYQDIMGDLHNLFGRVNEVHVFLDDNEQDGFYIEESISGFSTEEILDFIQYKGDALCRQMKKQIDGAVRKDRVRAREGVRLLNFYSQSIKGKTYLSPRKAKRAKK